MVYRCILLIAVGCSFFLSGIAQTKDQSNAAQLLLLIKKSASDTGRVSAYLTVAGHYINRFGEFDADLDSAAFFIVKADLLSKQIHFYHGQLRCRYWSNVIFLERSKWPEAGKNAVSLAADFASVGDTLWQAKTLEIYGKYLPMVDVTLVEKLEVFKQVIVLYKALKNMEEEVRITREIAEVYRMQGKADLAEQELMNMLKICKAKKFPKLDLVLVPISYLHKSKGNYNLALYYLLEAVKYRELRNVPDVYHPYTDIARIYYDLDENKKGLEWHMKAFEDGKINFPQSLYHYFSLLIGARLKEGQLSEAFQLINQTRKDFPPKISWEIKSIELSLANYYNASGKYELAEKYYLKVLSGLPFLNTVALYNSSIARFYIDWKYFSKAKPYALTILHLDAVASTAADVSQAHYMLYKIDSAEGKYLSALNHLALHKQISDSIFTQRKTEQAQVLQIQYETVQKEQELQLKEQRIGLLTKESLLKEALLKQAKTTRNIIVSGSCILLLLLGFSYRRYREKQQINKVINKKNSILKQLVTEKEWLLKEVHHRVKNNLQTVVSLLESQSAYLQDDALLAIQESQNRVYAMSLIHQKLYQAENVASINMETYLPELVNYLTESFDTKNIYFKLKIEPVSLDVSQAIPVGLIVNEAITNSIKYAFNDASISRQIMVAINQYPDEKVSLTISDNGVGMPADFNSIKTGSLGLKLMTGLTEDLEGEFLIQSDKGTKISIAFTANKPLHQLNLQPELTLVQL